MNFLFVSPHFPTNFYHFCVALKENGVNVLGVGDTAYDNLSNELKGALTEYYKVNSLENYDEVYRAVAFFCHKYGKMDWIESNNEYWLLQDAKLRTDFNVTSGVRNDQIDFIKYKSEMKKLYALANVKTARYHIVDNYENTVKFIEEVGYPVIVKPDNGVGASNTFKIKNIDDLNKFFSEPMQTQIIMEEFINGELVSYDGIADANREVIFETSHYFPSPVMNIVNERRDCNYWSVKEIPADLKAAGRATVKAFPTNSRCFHLEFFRLLEDKKGLGNKGDILGLEVNMRTPGGFTPDMMNFGSDVDMYRIYADMIAYGKPQNPINDKKYYVAFASRRDEHVYKTTIDDVKARYADKIVLSGRNAPAIAVAMGNDFVIARFEDFAEIAEFLDMMNEDYK